MASPGSQSHVPPTLASRPLPRRVRDLLEGILEYCSGEIERGLTSSLNEYEQQLFKFAEQARSNQVQTRWLDAQRLVKRNRPDVIPRFLIAMEAELATIRDGAAARGLQPVKGRSLELSLVDNLDMDEVSVLTEISNRAELRNSLPLYLLGQRFGVLAGRPALDAESLPIGPQAICRMLRSAVDGLELIEEHRMMFIRTFERQVVPLYGSLVDAVNTYLARNGVLPHLQYVPVRLRPAGSAPAAERVAEPAKPRPRNVIEESESLGLGGDAPLHAHHSAPRTAPAFPSADSRPGQAGAAPSREPSPNVQQAQAAATAALLSANPAAGTDESFMLMRQLLGARRQLLDKLVPERTKGNSQDFVQIVGNDQLQQVLSQLQGQPIGTMQVKGKTTERTLAHLKQDMLAKLRQAVPGDAAPALAEEDNDTIDLIGMLFESLMKDVRPNSPASMLLSKLQVPLLRVALQDKGFFTRQMHPARQMLNTIAETGSFWLAEDDVDTGLIEKLTSVVDRTNHDFTGDISLFSTLLSDLSSHLQTQARKAEVAERRHVEAARGKEKLALARERASRAVEGLLKQQNLPRFTHTLLSQAWTDVMALTALRHGEDSGDWKHQLQVAEQLIQISRATGAEQAKFRDTAGTLQQEVEHALSQVGYQGDEASVIAQRLVQPQSGSEADSASRTELTMRMKARARLGEDMQAAQDSKVPLTPEEQKHLERLKHVPFGSWFEFTTNQQGDKVKRRLSWFSTVTGHVLFVNHRGQRIGDFTLESLARQLAQGQLRVIDEEKGSLIDRAWNSVLNALRSFAGQTPEGATT
ncbi:DUF1631 domain-containing protein [Arenimonas sp.]|uniref:DUF1631 domain-containing protein n=1 Tax=Arenimonas sp. TaxID=1872635 RepID=UPI0039E23788